MKIFNNIHAPTFDMREQHNETCNLLLYGMSPIINDDIKFATSISYKNPVTVVYLPDHTYNNEHALMIFGLNRSAHIIEPHFE